MTMKRFHPAVLINLLIIILLLSASAAAQGKLFGYRYNDNSDVLLSRSAEFLLDRHGLAELQRKKISPGILQLSDKNNKSVAQLINSRHLKNRPTGYGGPLDILILLDAGKKITDIQVYENTETPSFYESVIESGFLEALKGKSIADAEEVDTVSGATMTSSAIKQTVLSALTTQTKLQNAPKQKVIPLKSIILLAIILTALILSSKKFKNSTTRNIQLLINTIALGFGLGKFIALAPLLNIFSNPITTATISSAAILFMSTVLASFFGKKSFYCMWLCPFGSLQELLAKLNKKKIRLSTKTLNRLTILRTMIWMSFLILMLTGIGSGLLNYEPFSAFIFTQASPAVLILAGLTAILSMFIHRPWCRFICPTGRLLEHIDAID